MHAVFDGDSLVRQIEREKQEAVRAAMLDKFLQTMNQQRLIDEHDWNNFESQQGRRLTAQSFEAKVKKLLPKIVFFTKPLTDDQARFVGLEPGSSIKSMDLLLPDGKSRPIIGFQNHPILPEYTVLLQRKIKTQNIPVTHASTRDFGKSKRVFLDGRWQWEYDELTPFETWSYEPAGTLVGWRSILARLVVPENLLSPETIEREFGVSDRATWAERMGKRSVDLTSGI